MPRDHWLAYLFAALMIAFGGFLILAAPAMSHDAQGNANWIAEGRYTDKAGVHCCGVSDCPELAPSDVRATNAGVLIIKTGEVVPWAEATPSEDGKIWRCQRADGSRRCFFYPAGGS